MDFNISQYLNEQRQMAGMILEQHNKDHRERMSNPPDHRERERNRDRDRRRDRNRDRRRRDRRYDDEYGNDRDRSRERYDHHNDDRSRERGRDRYQDNNHHSYDDYNEDSYQGSLSQGSGDDYGGELDYSEGAYQVQESMNSSNGRDRRRDRHEKDNHIEERGGEKWMTDTPSNTVLLRGLPMEIDEKDIRAELMLFGIPVKEVRLMKRKDTGASRGFAFVEFQSVQDAQNWMEHNQGQLMLLNQYTVNMYYSTPRVGPVSTADRTPANAEFVRTDWICAKCGAHNFKRRDYCFKCNIPREESLRAKEGDGFEHVGNNPCNTLVLRGLDALTTEENMLAAIAQHTGIPVKNVKVIRDDVTNTSRGYGFIELHSIKESTQVLDILQKVEPFEVDGKAVLAAYAKNTFTTTLTTLTQATSTAASWDSTQTAATPTSTATSTDYSTYYQQTADGQYYDPATGQYYEYDYATQQYFATTQAQTTEVAGKGADTTNAAAAVAQAAIQQAQAVKQYHKQQEEMQKQILAQMQHQQKLADMTPEERLAHQAQEWSTQTDGTEYAKYPTPDVSTYQYDETSGYYYDPTTGLYYDANTQYYYNSTTQQFMYWDGEKQTYLPASPEDQEGLKKDEENKKKNDKNDKKEKVKVAKKIAKDMEKWAKTLNAQKEAFKEGHTKKMPSPAIQAVITNKESATADAGFAILEKRAVKEEKLMPPPPMPGGGTPNSGKPGLVASYGGDSDDDDDDDTDESKLSDWSKMACLLCKRQFPSKEGLQRHNQMSDLHKTNLENYRKSRGQGGAGGAPQYRDRAKERRAKFGVPEPPMPRKRPNQEAPVPFEQPTKAGITADNRGSKMLQKMGWSAGQGLGKKSQGIVDPIQAMKRNQSAGLGARGSNYNVEPGDTYKDTVKKMMQMRYQESE